MEFLLVWILSGNVLDSGLRYDDAASCYASAQNIKIGFIIEEQSFPNFAESFLISKNQCGIFEDMADDSFIIPLKTDDLNELELFDCHTKVLQEKLGVDEFDILRDRVNTAISLVKNIEITNKYF
jgi:hypothetical protein